MTIPSEIQKTELPKIIELFELAYTPTLVDVFRFTSHQRDGGVRWKTFNYQTVPIETSGFEISTGGSLPRPRVRVSNIGTQIDNLNLTISVFSALIRQYNDLIGAKLVRHATLETYLDGEPGANPTMEFPDSIWYINQKALESDTVIEWELSSSLDLEGREIPRRLIIANACQWQYRSAECTYSGGPVSTALDVPTTDPLQDSCGKRIKSCGDRFGANALLPYGAFPGATRY